MSLKISEHFELTEFINPDIYKVFGDNSRWFINPDLIKLVEFIRSYFNKSIIINNWATGGDLSNCGLRQWDCANGAKYSQHKYGNAADLHLDGVTDYEAIRNEIRKNQKIFFDSKLMCIEQGTNGWLHIDTRNTGLTTILEVPFQ